MVTQDQLNQWCWGFLVLTHTQTKLNVSWVWTPGFDIRRTPEDLVIERFKTKKHQVIDIQYLIWLVISSLQAYQ